MLIAIFAAFLLNLFGGDPSTSVIDTEAMRSLITDHVADSIRRDEAFSLLDDADSIAAEYGQTVVDTLGELGALHRDHSTTDAEIDALIQEVMAERDRTRSALLDIRFSLRDQLTQDEWQLIFAHSD